MKEIFLEAQAAILGIKKQDGKPLFKYCRIDSGQLERIRGYNNTNETIAYPAALIRFWDINYEGRGGKTSRGKARMRVSIVLSNPIPDDLEIFDIRLEVHRALIYSGIDNIHRVFEDMPESYGHILEWVADYRVDFDERSAYMYRDAVEANTIENPIEWSVNDQDIREDGEP